MENPRNSDLWRTEILQDHLEGGMVFAKADLCRFGLKSKNGKELLRKPISLLTNSQHRHQHNHAQLMKRRGPQSSQLKESMEKLKNRMDPEPYPLKERSSSASSLNMALTKDLCRGKGRQGHLRSQR